MTQPFLAMHPLENLLRPIPTLNLCKIFLSKVAFTKKRNTFPKQNRKE